MVLQKAWHSSRRCFGVLVFFLGGIFCIFLTCFYAYFWDCFDIKLIVNKRGAPEAPPTHYPINFISKKSLKYIEKHIKNVNICKNIQNMGAGQIVETKGLSGAF